MPHASSLASNLPSAGLSAAPRPRRAARKPGLGASASQKPEAGAMPQDLPSQAQLRQILLAACPAGQLSEPALASLLGLGFMNVLPAKSMCLLASQRAEGLWLLLRGIVSVGRHDAQMQWSQRCTVHAEEWIDAESAWLGGNYLDNARAETEVLLWFFPLPALERAIAAEPALARSLLAVGAERLQRAVGGAQDLLAKHVLARCAAWLLEELRALGQGESSSTAQTQLVLSQRKCAIASQLGTSPETFSRSLRQLREMGVIAIKGYRIWILDLPALIGLAKAV
nr:Crp/Fnr family transcriptional regulator [uncultured Roseateles sp.]